MDRRVFHVDVNSAFLSWEAAKRVREGLPDIREIPSAIGGDREKRTGIILAKSIPAKKYGIQTGEPVALALRKCPDLFLAKPDFLLYSRNSKAFIQICTEYAPVVEQFSIDECFLDMSGVCPNDEALVQTAYALKDRIKNELGFTVNVGVGSNKLLAKMASDFEKPDKVHTLFQTEIREKIWHLPVGDLFGVGASTKEKLEKVYIRTIGQLAQTNEEYLIRLLGDKLGKQLAAFANGIDESDVKKQAEEAKGYSNSVTVEKDVADYETADAILLELADSVTLRMRSDNKKASCISISVRYLDFSDKSHQCRFLSPTDTTNQVYTTAKKLLRELWNGKTPLRLMGLALTDLDSGDEQMNFYETEKDRKDRDIDLAMDALRNKFGMDAIMRGTSCKTDIQVGKKHRALAGLEKKENN